MKTNNIMCVIDTNILVASFAELSPIHWVFEKIRDHEIDISVTTDIIEEYAEMTAKFYSPQASKDLVELLISAGNVRQVIPYYQWHLISADPDDNKFVDCAICSEAAFILTHDKHFNILKDIDFPKVNVIKMHDFAALFGK